MRSIRLLKNEIAREAEGWVEENIILKSPGDKFCELFDEDYHRSKSHTSVSTPLLVYDICLLVWPLLHCLSIFGRYSTRCKNVGTHNSYYGNAWICTSKISIW